MDAIKSEKKCRIEKTLAFSKKNDLFSYVKNRKTFAKREKSKRFLAKDAAKSEG